MHANKSTTPSANPAVKPGNSRVELNSLLGRGDGQKTLSGLSKIGKGPGQGTSGSNARSGSSGGLAGIFASMEKSSTNETSQSKPPPPTPGLQARNVSGANGGAVTNSTGGLLRTSNSRKKRKTVTWKSDKDLVAIKEIEPAVYDDDHSVRPEAL